MHLAADRGDPLAAVRRVASGTQVVHDYRPLHKAFEWQLSELYWATTGVQPFSASEVPFAVTSSGRLSEHAAAILFASCVEAEPTGQVAVLELGAGTGLFARYFLDAFRGICEQERRDFYSRLVYLVTDRSARAVRHWSESALFEEHGAHVVLATCDATDPHGIRPLTPGEALPERLRAVFCNYVLDVLPATVIRQRDGVCEELRVRTILPVDGAVLRQRFQLGPEEIRALAETSDPREHERLLPMLDLIELEAAFHPCASPPPYVAEALEVCAGRELALVNHGALACLEGCLSVLEPDGWVLINDYGPVRGEDVAEQALSQRFGSTSAIGVDFPLLDALLPRRGVAVLVPEGDADRALHSRLILRNGDGQTAAAFRDRFGKESSRYFEEPLELARQFAATGRNDEALDHYRIGLERNPRDWAVLGEIAEFVGLQLREYGAGLELARTAAGLNPWYSPWLWNVLGDCLFCLERFDDAHEAYLQAQRIDPHDVRTNLNLAYMLAQRGAYTDALQTIALALARDGAGLNHRRLLDQQQRILGQLTQAWTERQEGLARRATRLRAAAAIGPTRPSA